MFERFSDEARLVVRLAQDEARRFRHGWIGTEHLLIALLEEGDGSAAQVLRGHGLSVPDLRRRVVGAAGPSAEGLDPDALAVLGIDLNEVRRVTEENFGPGALERGRRPVKNGHIPFSGRAKKVLELSLREAMRLKHDYIGTGHILLGLLREGEGLAARILADAGADLGDLRDEVTRLIPPKAA